ncbi:DUF4440 domain-containing protein [Roseiconus nitratireducens]|uniref:DUF4440 domain-containing protein n=1 Tax=Roseiconus nitratireducens TaxID=2605748 RepID=A0A5M6DFF1_9BACT|nr:DUF4440 domain-containing protein [Roseiconus nitratireducens]KAA5545126.1 DUF4440 domain-containing protein [Roseiconus nitratireducens]
MRQYVFGTAAITIVMLALSGSLLRTCSFAQEVPAASTAAPAAETQASETEAAGESSDEPASTAESPAGSSAPDSADAEVRQAVEAYVNAFNARDVDALIALWSPEGVYSSRTSGDQLVGRDALRQDFSDLLSDEGAPTLAVITDSIEFISPSVAIERGSATIRWNEESAEQTTYTAVYIKQGETWLLDRVTEADVVEQPSHYEHLKSLEWLVGDWIYEGETWTVEFETDWTVKQNFLSRRYTVTGNPGNESSGLQIIGWDPLKQQIRSWLFDSDGGYVHATWLPTESGWSVQSVATLADGGRGSFTSHLEPIDENSYRWEKVNRVLDGQILPSLDPVTVRRK